MDEQSTQEMTVPKGRNIFLSVTTILLALLFAATFFCAQSSKIMLPPDEGLSAGAVVMLFFTRAFVITYPFIGAVLLAFAVWLLFTKNAKRYFRRTKALFAVTAVYAPFFLVGSIFLFILSMEIKNMLFLSVPCIILFWVDFGLQNSLNKYLTNLFQPPKRKRKKHKKEQNREEIEDKEERQTDNDDYL